MKPDWSRSKEVLLRGGERAEDRQVDRKLFSPLTEGQRLHETEPRLRTGGFRGPTAGRDG